MTINPEERRIEVGEFSLNFAKAGSGGDALVLLHGGDPRGGWRSWEPLLSLSSDYAMIMPDLIGFGGSSSPAEVPDYTVQARVVRELMDRLSIPAASFIGSSWGGQVALEVAIEEPKKVKSIVLIASTYDRRQIPKLKGVRRPALILWAEDDMITQVKAGYLLRDAIGTSRLEVLEPVAKDPRYHYSAAHELQRFRSGAVLEKVRRFLGSPQSMIEQPPELERELKGLALRKDEGEGDE